MNGFYLAIALKPFSKIYLSTIKMKHLLLLGAFICTFGTSKAQTSGTWNPLWLSSTNMFKGVEGFYQLTTCNGKQMVLLKFVNHNNYAIKAGWKGTVITIDGQQHIEKATTDSLTVSANSQLAGDCSSNTALLVVNLKDFNFDLATFKAFKATDFDFKPLHQ
jgi:hypothetical protein